MKANGTWKQNIAGYNISISIKNKEARYLAEGGYEGGGTCEDAGDILRVAASAVAHAKSGVTRHHGLVYLATPYSSPDADVRAHRFDEVNRCAAEMMSRGISVFSPISHSHPIALAGTLPTNWEFWRDYDYAMLQACCRMAVLMQDGWRQSVGVQEEIAIARRLSRPVEYIPHNRPYKGKML